MSKNTGKGNPDPNPPSSRGVPADETLFLPKHYGSHLKEKGGLDKTIYWDESDVVDFIFPKTYQPKYHRVAVDFIKLVLERDWVTKKEISSFLKKTGYSKSTLENKIIPKLVRFGLLKRQREFKQGLKKGRGLILSESLTFSNYLEKIAFSWNMLVSTSRSRGKIKD